MKKKSLSNIYLTDDGREKLWLELLAEKHANQLNNNKNKKSCTSTKQADTKEKHVN